VPGTVATLRLVDWNQRRPARPAAGGMGDAYGEAKAAACSVPQRRHGKAARFGGC
jgi:hypothetical protein